MYEDLPTERLEAEITTLAAHLAAAMCRWLLLVAELDRRRGWESWECRSCAHWLSWKCGIDARTAREHLRVGHAIARLGVVRGAFERGELSYSQVRAVTRVATPETEAGLVDLAKSSTAAQLERVVRASAKVLELDDVQERHARRSLSVQVLDDGSYELRVRLSPEDGELAKVTVEAFTHALPFQGGSAEPPSARAADGFMDMVRASRAADPVATDTTDRCQVVLIDEPDGVSLANGTRLHPETARRLACDSSVVAMSMKDGQPLDIGRRTRSIPTGMSRAMRRRDQRCRFPGCEATRFLHGHHIQHWTHHGHTALHNLVLLCPFHHRLLHEGRYTANVDAFGRLAFHHPDGTVLAVEPLHVVGPDIEERNRRIGIDVDHRTAQSRWAGEHLDLAAAVDVAIGGT